jgi:hypothetical protein
MEITLVFTSTIFLRDLPSEVLGKVDWRSAKTAPRAIARQGGVFKGSSFGLVLEVFQARVENYLLRAIEIKNVMD